MSLFEDDNDIVIDFVNGVNLPKRVRKHKKPKNIPIIAIKVKKFDKYNRKTLIRYLSRNYIKFSVYMGKPKLLKLVLQHANQTTIKHTKCAICLGLVNQPK